MKTESTGAQTAGQFCEQEHASPAFSTYSTKREGFGDAYQNGFTLTVRFLMSKGVSNDLASETAQAAWTKGWERRGQLRNPEMIVAWVNSIAFNLYRNYLRKQRCLQVLPELATSSGIDMAALDAPRILKCCSSGERQILQWAYIDGYRTREIANRQGWTETAARLRLMRARRSAAKKLEQKSLSSSDEVHAG